MLDKLKENFLIKTPPRIALAKLEKISLVFFYQFLEACWNGVETWKDGDEALTAKVVYYWLTASRVFLHKQSNIQVDFRVNAAENRLHIASVRTCDGCENLTLPIALSYSDMRDSCVRSIEWTHEQGFSDL